jgi:hypothetical protein
VDEWLGSFRQQMAGPHNLSSGLWYEPPLASMAFAASLKAFSSYVSEAGPIANSRFTLLLSEVETSSGPMVRFVAFVNYKGGLPRSLARELTDEGYTIYRADPFENHAEIAAQNYRADTGAQVEDLGGPIRSVTSAVMNNEACSEQCLRPVDLPGRA